MAGAKQLGCSAQEWGVTLARVLKAVGGMGSEDIAVLRREVVVSQELKEEVAACLPEAPELQRPHVELLRLIEQQVKVLHAVLRQLEFSLKAEQSGYGKQHMREYLRAETAAGQAIAEQKAAFQSFALVMVELVTNHKDVYELLGLPPELSFEPG